MAVTFSGSGQYLNRAAILKGSAPWSFACWIKTSDITTNQNIFCQGSTTTTFQYFSASIASSAASVRQDNSSGASATSAASLVTNTWFHFAGVFASNTSRLIYLNGVSVSNATSIATPTNLNTTTIAAAFQGAGAVGLYNGIIAFPTVWNVALSATDVTNLYNAGAGQDPYKIQTAGLLSLSMLAGSTPWIDMITGVNWTTTGAPSNSADPFTINRFAGTCTGLAANTGVLAATKPLAGTCTGHAANTGVLAATKPLAGTCTGLAANTGVLTVTKRLAGTCTGHAANTGTLALTRNLAGTCTGHAIGTTGTLLNKNALVGTCTGHAISSGTLKVSRAFVGTCTGRAASTGVLKVTHPLSGFCLGASTSLGTLTVIHPLIPLGPAWTLAIAEYALTSTVRDLQEDFFVNVAA